MLSYHIRAIARRRITMVVLGVGSLVLRPSGYFAAPGREREICDQSCHRYKIINLNLNLNLNLK
jgi:hypothetical protein